jgi:hypothetical protein
MMSGGGRGAHARNAAIAVAVLVGAHATPACALELAIEGCAPGVVRATQRAWSVEQGAMEPELAAWAAEAAEHLSLRCADGAITVDVRAGGVERGSVIQVDRASERGFGRLVALVLTELLEDARVAAADLALLRAAPPDEPAGPAPPVRDVTHWTILASPRVDPAPRVNDTLSPSLTIALLGGVWVAGTPMLVQGSVGLYFAIELLPWLLVGIDARVTNGSHRLGTADLDALVATGSIQLVLRGGADILDVEVGVVVRAGAVAWQIARENERAEGELQYWAGPAAVLRGVLRFGPIRVLASLEGGAFADDGSVVGTGPRMELDEFWLHADLGVGVEIE